MTSAAANTEALSNRDYTMIIDKSGSMDTEDMNGKSRWHAVQESAKAVARKLDALDPDGITLYTFSGNFKRYDNVHADSVDKVFQENEPMGSTALHLVLRDAFTNWQQRKKKGETKNGETIVVVTDGEPDDRRAVATEIKNITKVLDNADELKVKFFQIGKDSSAASYLKHLDDDLQSEGAKHDIVSAITFDQLENTSLKEALLAD